MKREKNKDKIVENEKNKIITTCLDKKQAKNGGKVYGTK
jgi:hypothetical protein